MSKPFSRKQPHRVALAKLNTKTSFNNQSLSIFAKSEQSHRLIVVVVERRWGGLDRQQEEADTGLAAKSRVLPIGLSFQKDGKATEHGTIHQQKGKIFQIASFGEDAEGELYLLPLVANPATKRDPAGSILQLVAE